MYNGSIRRPARVAGLAMSQFARASRIVLLAGLIASALVAGASTSFAEPAPINGVVNVNTASSEELQLLPGVGEVRAEAIIQVRKEKGGFKQVNDLLEVKGVGPTMVERLRAHMVLKGKTTAQQP